MRLGLSIGLNRNKITEEAAPASVVLEGFEDMIGNTPDGMSWSETLIAGTGSPRSISLSHVTQGAGSMRQEDSLANYSTIAVNNVDLTGYSTMSLDVYVTSIDTNSAVVLSVAPSDDFVPVVSDQTTPSGTGSFTLTVDLTGFAPADLAALTITFGVDVLVAASDYYVDNLRVS